MTKRYAYNSKPQKAVVNFNSYLFIKARRNLLKSDIFQTKSIKRNIELQATKQVLSAYASTSKIQEKRSHSQTANTLLFSANRYTMYISSA